MLMKTLFCSLALLLTASAALAEWRTETFVIKPGWNAIFPNVDSTHVTIDDLLAAYPDILEVWRWQPDRIDPRLPTDVPIAPVGVEWATWKRGLPEETNFTRLDANYGYLVHLSETAVAQNLNIKGKPVLPALRLRSDGLSLIGFPVLSSGTTPMLSAYLAPSGYALSSTQILRYNGGVIASGINPAVINPNQTRLERGQALWLRVSKFSSFYGPLKVDINGGSLAFGTRIDEQRVLFTNQTTTSLTFTIASASSDTSPTGQSQVAVPMKVRVDAEPDFTPFTTRTITLAAGAAMPVMFQVDRDALSTTVGAHHASLLKIVTTAGVPGEEVYLPVTADVGSLAGLWIGEARITQVGSVVKRYVRDSSGNTVNDDKRLNNDGSANPNFGKPTLVEDLTTPGGAATLPGVKKGYTLRLIMHVDASGVATLLSHIYQGKLATAPPTEPISLALDEGLLDATALKSAVRLSVAHLPLDTALAFTGVFRKGNVLTSSVPLLTSHNRADNPFLHSYHPDHDNLDSRFTNLLPPGKESFNISRSFKLTFDALPPTASSNWGTTVLTGIYGEDIVGPHKDTLRVQGAFVLNKVSDITTISH